MSELFGGSYGYRSGINESKVRSFWHGYDGGQPFALFRQRVEAAKKNVPLFLRRANAEGKLVHGYGASTKGNTLLQHMGVTGELIPAIADRNPSKVGCRTPGNAIPIISEEASRSLRPDYYFVLPWHFRDTFVAREHAFLTGGRRFVFPLPSWKSFLRRASNNSVKA